MSDWTQQFPTHTPSIRYPGGLVLDESRNRVVLWGGGKVSTTDYLQDTWEWDGTDWTDMSPASPPSKRNSPGFAYDTARGHSILFGGINASLTTLSDTWKWDGSNWTQLTPTHHPSARAIGFMAYDAANSKIVLFGGFDGSFLFDTWTWNGTDWHQESPTHSPALRGDTTSMCFDYTNNNIVMWGGVNSSGTDVQETWVWDGTDWTHISTAHAPSSRNLFSMADSSNCGFVVGVGGRETGSLAFMDETWEWDGTDWTQLTPTNNPTVGAGKSCRDVVTGRILYFIGQDSSTFFSETWTFSCTPISTNYPVMNNEISLV
jgi:hypothetical protein